MWEEGAGCHGNVGAEIGGVTFLEVGGGLIGRLAAGLGVGVKAKVTRELVALAKRCIVSRSFSMFSGSIL